MGNERPEGTNPPSQSFKLEGGTLLVLPEGVDRHSDCRRISLLVLRSCRMVIALSAGASNILGDPFNAFRSLNSDKIHDCTVLEEILR